MKDLKYIDSIKPSPTGYNDIEWTAAGDIAVVEGTARVKQDIVKILLTETGLMPYPNYGSSLPSMVGNTPYSTTLLDAVSNEVVSAMHYLILSEESQEPSEQISELKTMDVSFSDSRVQLSLIVLTRDNTDIQLGFSL